jgi:glycine oxidase
VRGLVQGRACYLVPRSDGSLVIGATSEERGFDGSVQVGQVFALLDDARRLVPGLDELAFEEAICGFRPATPDNAPYVGWTTTERLAVATGHYRNGILLAPITAAALVALYAGAAPPSPMGHFGAERGSHLALGARGALGEP